MRVFNLTTSQYALSNIALRRLKVARFNELNDPFELLAVDVASQELRAGILAKKNQVNSKEDLLCFSKSWKSPLLWSHYAEKYKGIALGFDIPDDMLISVNYIQGMQKLNMLSKKTKQETIDHFLHRLRFTKFNAWEYEDEVRQFFDLSDLEFQSGLYFVSFSNELQLREIILGSRCEIPIKSVRELVANFSYKVHVTKARIAYTKFGVVENRKYRQIKSG